MRYEHATMWPLCVMVLNAQRVRFMLLEAKYALSPKWLDATGNNGVDTVACDRFDRIVAMLRWGLRNVWVNDVENVLSRGRNAIGSQEAFDSREQVFDTMSLSEMKLLNRVAMHEWVAEKSRIQHMEHDELLHEQIAAFDIAHLRSRVDVAGMPREHPAAAVGDELEDAGAYQCHAFVPCCLLRLL